jgi:hypothetical protein
LAEILISERDVEDRLEQLKATKAMGPDGVHPLMLRSAASALCKPIALIFRKNLEEGVLPKEWKQAYVTAIFKKGDKQHAKNYRPVSLTSIICKIIEAIIRKEIVQHMIRNSLLSDSQYGFVQKGRLRYNCFTPLKNGLES